jgi:hypothetical protein
MRKEIVSIIKILSSKDSSGPDGSWLNFTMYFRETYISPSQTLEMDLNLS